MKIQFIGRHTELRIVECTRNDEVIWEYAGIFEDAETILSFLVTNNELFEHADEIRSDAHFDIHFYQDDQPYSFKGKYREKIIRDGTCYIHIDQISDIVEESRRIVPRLELSMPVYVFESMKARGKAEMVDCGQTQDVSIDGLCLLTDTLIPVLEREHRYWLEFSFNKGERFLLPARLARRGSCPQSVQYKYDYGFLFDYENHAEERTRLITALFVDRIGNGVKRL